MLLRKPERGEEVQKEAWEWEREFLKSTSANMDMMLGAFVDVYFRDKAGELKERTMGEATRQEVSELSATNLLLKGQAGTLAEDKEKLLSENEKLEKQQKKLQQEINKMAQSKEVMERNIHAYDEEMKWQLAEPGALVSAKNYRYKKGTSTCGEIERGSKKSDYKMLTACKARS